MWAWNLAASLREEHRLRVSENGGKPQREKVTGEWRKLLSFLLGVTRAFESRRM
jgi:hypothetical protein